MTRSRKIFINNLITYGIVIAAFIVCQLAVSGSIDGFKMSRSLKGQLVPICVYIVMAVSLNLTVGISGELSLGHAGFMSVGAFSGIIMSTWLATAFQMENETLRLILDPPRAGIARSVLKALLKSGIPKLTLISCNPATLARDLGILTGRLIEKEGELVKNPAYEGVEETLTGYYEITKIQPYDMFPQTKHVETLVCLARKAD